MTSKFPLKVCKLSEDSNSIAYTVRCDCGSKEHACDIYFEASKEWGYSVSFFYDVNYQAYSYNQNIFCEFWKRITGALRLLFVGYIELQGDLVIEQPEHFDNFIEALEEGREFMNATGEQYESISSNYRNSDNR